MSDFCGAYQNDLVFYYAETQIINVNAFQKYTDFGIKSVLTPQTASLDFFGLKQ